jgi:hypothetical protein
MSKTIRHISIVALSAIIIGTWVASPRPVSV